MARARAFALLAGLLLVAAPAAAQEPAPPADSAQAPPGPPVPPTELVFEREVFDYPTYKRRNPFRPLVGNQAGGPRFEQVRLRGIIWSADPQRSVALFGIGSAAAAAAEARPGEVNTKRLRVGEVWGNIRVVEIKQDQVVVSVEEFGLSERKTLELTRRRAGGGS